MFIFLKAFKIVFKNKFYIFLSLALSFVLIIFSTWLPNFKLIFTIFKSSSATFLEKVIFLLSLISSITTNFTWFAVLYTFLIALFFSINVAMLIFYIKNKQKFLQKNSVVGASGLLSGIFGIGCASCGTVILGPLLSFFGASGVIAYLPFGGQEFGVLGVILLTISIFMIAKKIIESDVCRVNKN